MLAAKIMDLCKTGKVHIVLLFNNTCQILLNNKLIGQHS